MRIINEEKKQPFVFKEVEMFGRKEEILDLAERSQMVKFILDDILMVPSSMERCVAMMEKKDTSMRFLPKEPAISYF